MKRLDTKHNEPTNQSSIKTPQIVNPTNMKTLFKTLGTKVINCQMPNVLFKIKTFKKGINDEIV